MSSKISYIHTFLKAYVVHRFKCDRMFDIYDGNGSLNVL
jgi:hypothetical protein